MIDFKKMYVETFKAIKNDTKLLDLLEIEHKDLEPNVVLKNVRKQIQETSRIEDLLKENAIKLAIHEGDQGYKSSIEETRYINIDILISKDKNRKERRALLLMQRLIEVLDTEQRKRRGLQALPIGLYGLEYRTQTLESRNTATGWEKFTVVFSYIYLL